MARPRRDPRLPKYCYLSKGRYILKPYLGNSKFGKEIVLCSGDSPLSEVWLRYEQVVCVSRTDTLEWLCLEYQQSIKFISLARSTKKDYLKYHRTIMDRVTNRTLPYAAITPGMLKKYLDTRAKEGAPVLANREMAYLSAVFTWAIQLDFFPMNTTNPCHRVERNPEHPRTRYVTDSEYELVYQLAGSPWYLRPLMELGYLCRMRPGESRSLLRSDLLEVGINTRRLKGSRDAITRWSPRLKKAIQACLEHETDILSESLFCNRQGCMLTASAVKSAWDRLMVKACKKGLKERFTIHDLKAKGISDFEGDKQAASGHKTAAMLAVYDRKKLEVDSTR